MRKVLDIIVIVLMFFFICYFVVTSFIKVKDNYVPPKAEVCKKGHYEKSPHHIMCLNGNQNILCNNPSEWETYYVCDEK